MRTGVWVRRLAVGLLAACFGWVLPAHRHAPGAAHHAAAAAAAADDDVHASHDDHGAGHNDDPHGDGGSPPGGHGDRCDVCYAARTLCLPVPVAMPALAPDAVGGIRRVDPDRVVSLRLIPVYRGRAPPARSA